MSSSEHDELDLDAAEYVLGTLDAEHANAFQQRLVDDASARRRLADWEFRLARLGLDLEPVEPPAHIWTQVVRQTGLSGHHESDTTSSVTTNATTTRVDTAPAANDSVGVRGWRRLAVAASVMAVLFLGLWVTELPFGLGETGAPTYASVIYDQPTGMSWLVTSSDSGKALSVEAMSDYSVPSDKVLRMWIKPANGQPHLVGQLPHERGHYKMALTDDIRASLNDRSRIMVSMEDSARTDTDAPTGKLMWVSPVAHRTTG